MCRRRVLRDFHATNATNPPIGLRTRGREWGGNEDELSDMERGAIEVKPLEAGEQTNTNTQVRYTEAQGEKHPHRPSSTDSGAA